MPKMNKLSLMKVLAGCLSVILVSRFTPCSANGQPEYETHREKAANMNELNCRGVVYDVGLQYNPGSYSVEKFNPDLVKYDMSVIVNTLHANTVRIEGEDISRLVCAAEIAHATGLKVFFNPWKMGADAEETVAYMREAAAAAEKLRLRGIELVFVAGCEYSLFSKGIFQGETVNERIAYMIANAATADRNMLSTANEKLNVILADICKAVRGQFKGSVTYASGTWEDVDWDLFDIIGVDYYRNGEPEQQYIDGLKKYESSKPLIVMEVGCCTYEGAAAKGSTGFTIFQGVNPDGTVKYEGDKIPVRSEKEQADYIETQIGLLGKTNAGGVFIFVFAFPIMPHGEEGSDQDMTSYSLVKSFPEHDPRSQKIPGWEPKESYYRLAKIYSKMAESEE